MQRMGKSVILSFQTVNPASIDVLSGVLDYIRERQHPWNVRLITPPLTLTRTLVESARADGIDGILVNHPLSNELGVCLRDVQMPLVALGNTDDRLCRRRQSVVFLGADNRLIGRMAAQYFLSLGRFRSFAFLPDIPASRWSRLRLRGYRCELQMHGRTVRVFSTGATFCSSTYNEALQRYLLALPKPSALLLAGDYHSTSAFEACRAAGLRIPGDISVLGVDNNPIFCATSVPSLSSVAPDYRREGYDGACALERLMRLQTPALRPQVLWIPPRRIVVRDSTCQLNLGASLVERALNYISANAQSPITVADVARHLGVSQSLLNLRFRQHEKTSVYASIINARLERVSKLLRETDASIVSIAEQCGFSSATHLTRLYKLKCGHPPSHCRPLKSSER